MFLDLDQDNNEKKEDKNKEKEKDKDKDKDKEKGKDKDKKEEKKEEEDKKEESHDLSGQQCKWFSVISYTKYLCLHVFPFYEPWLMMMYASLYLAAVAVIGLALLAMGEDIGAEMCYRSLGHLVCFFSCQNKELQTE